MEAPCNPAYQQYLAERAEEEAWRIRLQEGMAGRVQGEGMEGRWQGEGMEGEGMDSTQFLPSMASHCIMPTQVDLNLVLFMLMLMLMRMLMILVPAPALSPFL